MPTIELNPVFWHSPLGRYMSFVEPNFTSTPGGLVQAVLQQVELSGLRGSEEQDWAPREELRVPLGKKHDELAKGMRMREMSRGILTYISSGGVKAEKS